MELLRHGGKSILFIMAVEAEYGEHLRRRFKPLITGVGPVEAAIAAAHTLAEFSGKGGLPDLIVSLGSAGSRKLEQANVYQASSVSFRDMDASPLGFEKGVTPFLDLPAVLDLPLRVPEVETASLSTGANIVSGAAYDTIEADMVDMETFAIMRAAMRFKVPLVALRGISDGAAELHHIDDWTEYLHIVDENLGQAVDRLLAAVGEARIQL